jgi:hypothetical protein
MLFNSKYSEIILNFLCKIFGMSYFSPSIKFKKSVSFLLFILSFVLLGIIASLVIFFMNPKEFEILKKDIEGQILLTFYATNVFMILTYAYVYEKYEYKIHEKIAETKTITLKLERETKLNNVKSNISIFKKCLGSFTSYILIISRIVFINLGIWMEEGLDIVYIDNHSMMIITLFCYHYENTVRKLAKSFEKLNQLVDQKFESGDMKPEIRNRKSIENFLWEIGKCYDNLHESSEMINKRFGTCVFLGIFCSLSSATYSTFYLLIGIMKNQNSKYIIGNYLRSK